MAAACDESLSEVFRLLRERAGIEPESCGVDAIAHVVRQRTSASGADSPQLYLRRLLAEPAEFQELLEDILVPETWFFRDSLAFRAVQYYLDACHSRGRATFRCLSAACSTGEEVYSLAIAMRDANLEPSQFHIVGADVSRRSLDLAQHGIFTSRSFRDPDARIGALCNRWCERRGESWRVHDALRTGVEFRWGNLSQPEFLAGELPFDLIFCRNVLIYFHTEARRVAVQNLDRLLRPGGLLCCAAVEARLFSEAGFCSLSAEYPFAFRRQDSAIDVPAASVTAWRQRSESRPPFVGTVSATVPDPPHADGAVAAANRADPGASVWHSPPHIADATNTEAVKTAMLLDAQQAADSGRLDVAETLCAKVLALEPGSAEAHYLRGVIRQAQGMLNEAQESLEKALYLDPRHHQALVHMVLLAERRGNRRLADNYRRRARQTMPMEAK